MITRLRTVSPEGTGRRIASYMQANNMSVADVADYCLTTKQCVYKWRGGKHVPSIDQLATLASLFGVTVDDIIVTDERMVTH